MRLLYFKIVSLAIIIFIFSDCGSGDNFQKSPVDVLIRDMNDIPIFTIILYDMDQEGTFSNTYKHKYQIITERDSQPQEQITDWYKVSEAFFEQNINNMGMEIASKKDGKVTKEASPPGYTNYVGNSHYGHWSSRNDGTSFWEFYGQYAFMSSMFNMMTYPVHRNYYDDYRTNYYGRQSYYGPKTTTGGTMYGTNSDYNNSTKPNSTWSSNPAKNSFKNRVNSKVSRSSGSSGSKISRSSSRYSSSSSRSRSSGGFGK